MQLSTQLVPPYSGYLPDYATPGVEKVHAILLLKDLTKPIYSVRLTVKIEGQGFTLQTKPYFKGSQTIIEPGVPVEVGSDVLAQLLDSKNLDFIGLNKNDYEKRKVLPEGYYKICFIAYDYFNPIKIQVSNESCASAWMTISDPPQLNLPLCGSNVNTGTPQQLIFSWTPMNQGSPNSAQNTEYVFELWEMRPEGAISNNIVQTVAPVYSTTTDFTMFNYGITETALIPGMEYAWRIRAVDKNGYDSFKNKGYSPVCTFRYGSKYEGLGDALKIKLQATPLTARTAKLFWDSIAIYSKYTVNYRKIGWSDWFETTTINSNIKAYDLEPQMNYEARVQGATVEGFVGSWSNTVVFKTPTLAQHGCGDAASEVQIQNKKPLLSASAGIYLQVGQFEMLTTDLHGTNGCYSGLGRIDIPFLFTGLNVSFTNVFVNEDRIVTTGQVKALSDGIDKWLLNKAIQEAEDKADYIEGKIDSVIVKDKKVCTYANGDKTPVKCVDSPKLGDVLVVRDGDGNQYIIDSDGTVTKTDYLKVSTDELEASDTTKVIFKASPNRQYGFDEKKYAAWASDYEVIKLKNGAGYFVPYAGIADGKSDIVTAIVTMNNLEPEKLTFKTTAGKEVNATKINTSEYQVTVPADALNIYALYKSKKIGKLNVVAEKAISRKVVIVPVNGATIGADIEKELNNIYKQANVSWDIGIAKNFDCNYDTNNDGLDGADATLMKKYSLEMRTIRDAYKKDSTYDRKAYYLFAVNKFSDNATQGYMVRGRAVGFVASTSSATTIAHELGHGAFGLEHTFPNVEKGRTDNLMDYGVGINLNKTQWAIMHSPMPKLNWFDEEEDAAMASSAELIHYAIFKARMAYINNEDISLIKNVPGIGGFPSIVGFCYGMKIGADFFIKIGIELTDLTAKSFSPKKQIQVNGNKVLLGPLYFETANNAEAIKLYNYITNNTPKRNLLLFVGGFRPDDFFTKGPNEVWDYDKHNYWDGIDLRFVYRLGTRNVVYADGHDMVTTSDHKKYIAAMLSDPINVFVPNIDGFNDRLNNGKIAASNFLTKLQNKVIDCRKDADGNIIDTLDIVCHSMGYAYSLGMIETLKAKIHIGRYYIIAPENPSLGYLPEGLETVWHYGSDEAKEKDDHVAKQCPISKDLNNEAIRAKRPQEIGWIESHLVKNYEYIFNINKGAGYVKKR